MRRLRNASLVTITMGLTAACGDPELARSPDGTGGGGGEGTTNSSAPSTSPGVTIASSSGDGGAGGGDPLEPACGDSVVDPGEACDDGNTESLDGCTALCELEAGWLCLVPGEPCEYTVECGDGFIGGVETCDDQNDVGGDGCSATCTLEEGWICPIPGAACVAGECGDSIVVGQERCDDGNPDGGDGCSTTCQLEPGYKCDVPGEPCELTVCGDGEVEGSEQCDEIDEVTGGPDHNTGDGCGVDCKFEPLCEGFDPCTTVCGDGLRLPGGTEECDDGNNLPGDGCSPDCEAEPGYECEDVVIIADPLILPYVVRDFSADHPDMERPDDTGQLDDGIAEDVLPADGKPAYAPPPGGTISTSSAENYAQWYRDTPGVNFPFVRSLELDRLPGGEYQLDTDRFFPLTVDEGFMESFPAEDLEGNPIGLRNFHFTSEVRYWFEFKGTETFAFQGDDDVWVFVNNQLVGDIGGTHGPRPIEFELTPEVGEDLSMEVGNVYEIAVFHAERHTFASNFRLTLGDFTSPISECLPVCGDGIKTPDEPCDLGEEGNDGSYGGCNEDCTFGPRCGDGEVQEDEEECDDGANVSPYEGCAPGCQEGASCGDGNVDSAFGEECDDGVNDGGYGECSEGCVVEEFCGNGIKEDDEECDDGNDDNADGCRTDCTRGGIPN
jgi:fibro-slime domain-containing protein